MHYCKKIKQLVLASLLACLFSVFATTAVAKSSNLNIESAELEVIDEAYVLSADVDIKFSNEIVEAVVKGFVLNFIIEFQLATPRKYWFDDEIATVTRRIALSYHPLSRQFLLTNGNQQNTFATLDDAIEALSEINDLKVFQKSDVEKSVVYNATLLMRLDHTKLPKALQAEAISSEDWKMTSQRFEWSPNLFK